MTAFWCDDVRDVLQVTGADALTYLQGQISQDIRALVDGQTTYTFVLQPMGKIEALARITRRSAEHFVLDTDAGAGESLLARLNRFKIRVKVDITCSTEATIAVRGVSVAGGVPAWGLADASDLIGDGSPVEPPAGVRAGDPAELELVRIEAGWPAMGAEITDASIPAETGVVPFAVNFTKGCYPGQELVERMDSRGSAAPRFVRRLRGVAAVPVVGDEIVHDAKSVGHVTSVASAETGWLALAIVARSVPVGASVAVSGQDVAVEDIGRTAPVAAAAPVAGRVSFGRR